MEWDLIVDKTKESTELLSYIKEINTYLLIYNGLLEVKYVKSRKSKKKYESIPALVGDINVYDINKIKFILSRKPELEPPAQPVEDKQNREYNKQFNQPKKGTKVDNNLEEINIPDEFKNNLYGDLKNINNSNDDYLETQLKKLNLHGNKPNKMFDIASAQNDQYTNTFNSNTNTFNSNNSNSSIGNSNNSIGNSQLNKERIDMNSDMLNYLTPDMIDPSVDIKTEEEINQDEYQRRTKELEKSIENRKERDRDIIKQNKLLKQEDEQNELMRDRSYEKELEYQNNIEQEYQEFMKKYIK